MNFEKKKIQLETLSEYLSAVRQNLELPIEEVSAKTGISRKFLEGLESNNFSVLPPPVYVVGFLRQLSLLYNLEPEILIQQYKKEVGILQQIVKKKQEREFGLKRFFGRVIITPKYLSLTVGVLFVCATIVYIIWQVLSINKTPTLEIFEPSDRQVIKDSYVNIKGKTDPAAALTVNGQNIFIDSKGNFQSQLGLGSGPKELKFTAKNKFDKSVTKVINITGESKAVTVSSGEQLQLKLEFSGDVTLAYSIDDAQTQTLGFHDGDAKVLNGQKKIVISTSDAGATKATLNGQAVGLLGRPKESLDNIPFFAENAVFNKEENQ